MFLDSALIMEYAHERGGSNGLELWPKDAFERLDMSNKMTKFDLIVKESCFFEVCKTNGKNDDAL